MPQGVNGLRKLRTTVIRHFLARKKTVKEARWPSSFWFESTPRKAKDISLKVAKLAKERK
jgi:hypothetical protein